MASRLDLQTMLEEISGTSNVYFQRPASISMRYPAIEYSLDKIKNGFGNNNVYGQRKRYKVTLIDKNPDSPLIDRISKIPTCEFDRQYRYDNLNHTVFTIYF